jgi:general secretion pathway protein H
MAPTDRKEESVQLPTSPAGRNEWSREDGFTLLEVVCVIAIIAIFAAIVAPALPVATSRARLQSYAVATAALLKADRNAAFRRNASIATEVNAASRFVRSGATGRVVRIPDDVAVDSLLVARCNHDPAGSTIRFFASGMSCGGVIKLSRAGYGYEVRVNWFTGGIEIVPLDHT